MDCAIRAVLALLSKAALHLPSWQVGQWVARRLAKLEQELLTAEEATATTAAASRAQENGGVSDGASTAATPRMRPMHAPHGHAPHGHGWSAARLDADPSLWSAAEVTQWLRLQARLGDAQVERIVEEQCIDSGSGRRANP